MTAATRYLFGRAGPYGLLIPALPILKVAEARDGAGRHDIGPRDGETHDEATPANTIDLRVLFRLPVAGPGPLVTLAAASPHGWTLIFDSIGQLHSIEADAFLALPPIFHYAGAMFDAFCMRRIEGLHGLRLRSDPVFQPMPETAAA